LLVARCIGHDELPALGREEAIGDVDRDLLLALGREPVEEEREIKLLALGPVFAGLNRERIQLVVEQQPGLVEQAADQRGLAVIDRPAGDEPQQAFAFVLVQERLECKSRVRSLQH
jgi:hypothetical protein